MPQRHEMRGADAGLVVSSCW